jgi:hypothetical protein
MNYEKLKALTCRKANTPPRRTGAGYEEPPETPTRQEMEKFDALIRNERCPVKKVVKVTKPRHVAA